MRPEGRPHGALGLSALFVACTAVAVATPAAAFWVAASYLLLGMPGVLMFRSAQPRPMWLATGLAVGVAASLCAVTLAWAIRQQFTPAVVVVACICVGVAASAIGRHTKGDPVVSRWNDGHAALAIVAAVALAAYPLYCAGLETPAGFAYRPFFNADFFKHVAVAETIAGGQYPPDNPFAAGQPLHYYWLSHLLPATGITLSGGLVRGEDAVLAALVFQTAWLAMLLFFAASSLPGVRPVHAALAVALAIASTSFDGIAAQLIEPGRSPLVTMQMVNQEALDLTTLLGAPHQIAASSLQRLCLYLPQHQLALVLLAAWSVLFLAPEGSSSRLLAARCALVLPLPAISLAAGGLAAIGMTLGEVLAGRSWSHRALALVTLLLAWALCLATGTIAASPDTMRADPFLSIGDSSEVPLAIRLAWLPAQLVTSLGPGLLVGLFGLALLLREQRWSSRAVLAVLAPIAVGVAAIALGEYRNAARETVELQLKASFLVSFGACLGAAVLFSRARTAIGWSWPSRALVVALFGAGFVSTIHDVVWHTATDDRLTLFVPRDEMAALNWIRSHPGDLVYQEPLSSPYLLGGKDAWVPVFGGRPVRMTVRGHVGPEDDLAHAAELFSPQTSPERLISLAGDLRFDRVFVSRSRLRHDYDVVLDNMLSAGWIAVFRNDRAAVLAVAR